MFRRSADLALALALAAAAALLAGPGAALGAGFAPVRAALAVAFVLCVPGYVLVAALYPGRGLGPAERLLFSVGASIALAILGALVLDQTVWGLMTGAWLAWLGGATLLAAGIAWRRRLVAASESSAKASLNLRQGLLLGTAALLAATAVMLSAAPAPARGDLGYTLLWALPAADGNPNAARLGLQSSELTTMSYRLEVTQDGTSLKEWPIITLAPGQTFEQVVDLPAAAPEGVIEAVLTRLDQPEAVYRRVTLWRERPEG